MRHFKRDKSGKYTQGKVSIYRVLGVSLVILVGVFVLSTTGSTVEYHAERDTSTPIVSSEIREADIMREAQHVREGLNAKEKTILDELAQASSTQHALIAEATAKYEAVRAEKSAQLDEINKVRASF